jgi:hypothetical protein
LTNKGKGEGDMWRVGVKGFKGSGYAESVEEVVHAFQCLWVETPAGVRIEAQELRRVTFQIGTDEDSGIGETVIRFSAADDHAKVELDALGGLEIVYHGQDGAPLT